MSNTHVKVLHSWHQIHITMKVMRRCLKDNWVLSPLHFLPNKRIRVFFNALKFAIVFWVFFFPSFPGQTLIGIFFFLSQTFFRLIEKFFWYHLPPSSIIRANIFIEPSTDSASIKVFIKCYKST